jgi:hypothetical protein
MKIDGGCHCGYIAYEAEADPAKTYICHCTDCQTLSGSAFRTVLPTRGGYCDIPSKTTRGNTPRRISSLHETDKGRVGVRQVLA